MHITNISEASLSHLIQIAQETNEPVIIGKAGKPVAILSAYQENTAPRKRRGSWEGKVKMTENFDETSGALTENFYNSSIFSKQQ